MIKYLHPIRPKQADGLVAEIYTQIKRDFGKVVDPFLLHSQLPKLLAGVWMACRETELVGKVPRTTKEAVAAAVSVGNQCPFCIDAHTIMLNAAGERTTANAIEGKRLYEIAEPKVKAIAEWALATTSPNNKNLRSPPFSKEEAPEIVGTAVFYHYINRMAIILLGDTPLPSNSALLKSPLKRVAGLMFRGAVKLHKNMGESLDFLPPTDLPDDLRWAKTNPVVAQAFARFAAATNQVGEVSLSPEVREQVAGFVERWQGESIGVSKQWMETETCQLDEAQRSAAQLALLAALTPHQINERDILRFRDHFPDDTVLLGTLSWASFSVALRIGAWAQLALQQAV